ncbi:MAG: hypothetical protein ABWX57_02155 [Aeromicrobium sp.]
MTAPIVQEAEDEAAGRCVVGFGSLPAAGRARRPAVDAAVPAAQRVVVPVAHPID